METALHAIWTSIPQAAAIWITMLLMVAIAATVTLPGRRTTLSPAARRTAPAGLRPVTGLASGHRPADETVDLAKLAESETVDIAKLAGGEAVEVAEFDEAEAGGLVGEDGRRYAEEVVVAAARAAATAERCRGVWERAQGEVDAAWAAYDEADAVARRTAAAGAFPVLSRRRVKGENVDRERYLHHAATAACRNRQLSIAQLNDALAHRGWDARKHPVQQEVALHNAVREHRFAAYRTASARERETWEAAEQAAVALRSLRAEALAAKIRAGRQVRSAGAQWWAEQWQGPRVQPVAAA